MPINIGKNLKIQPTNDTKVSKFVRSYDKIYNYIEEKYQDETQNISLYDLLTSMLETYTISYDNVPTGATFTWKIGSQTLTNPATVYSGQVVEYELLYSDDSKCVGSFTVDDDYVLDVSELEPNQYLISITSDKTLRSLHVTRHYGTPDSYVIDYTMDSSNVYTLYADKNEVISYWGTTSGYSGIERDLDIYGVNYQLTVIQNNNISIPFPYEAFICLLIELDDENGNQITNLAPYYDSITFSGTSSNFDYKRDYYPSYFAVWTEKNNTISWNINISGYGPISDSAVVGTTTVMKTNTLVPYCSYTLTPIPSDSTVTLAASGYNTVSGVGAQTITVLKGTNVVWMIEKDDYETGSGTTTVTTNPQSETQEIEMRNFKVNIDDYEYTLEDGILKLTKYVGSGTTPTTPGLENI